MTIRHEFHPNQGFRFFRDDVSILLHASFLQKRGLASSSTDLNNTFKATNTFMQSVGSYDSETQNFSEVLTANDFPSVDKIEFYKFVPASTLSYLLSDSFQFGSIQYYRDIELQSSRDSMEGLANLAIHCRDRIVGLSLAGGYNFGIFCGVSHLDNNLQMEGRFGPRLIKISNLRAFAEEVRDALGASGYYINHVTYNDLKLFRLRTVRTFKFQKPGAQNDNFDPDAIDDRMFNFFYKSCFLSSLYVKPTRFSVEQELRLVFEMPRDVPDVLRVSGKGLAKYVEVIK